MHLTPRPERSLHPAGDDAIGRRLCSRMMLAAFTAACAVLIAACGSSASRTAATQAAATTATASAVPVSDPGLPARVLVRNSSLGRIIVDGHGRTLYAFSADHAGDSTCTATCAHSWSSYTTMGRPTSGPGVKASLLGVNHAADGQSMVTYRGHPLYRFRKDARPGQITGEDVSAFGGRWDVLSTAGTRITERYKAPATTYTAQSPSVTTQAAPPLLTGGFATALPASAASHRSHPRAHHPHHRPVHHHHHAGGAIPQRNGGDHDADNNGAPSDGDGNR
ncbi:MAG: COG4315 family predicted lipoprotein [Solirubrobacteraceae bacterium]